MLRRKTKTESTAIDMTSVKGRADEVFRWSPYSRSNLDIVNYGSFVRK